MLLSSPLNKAQSIVVDAATKFNQGRRLSTFKTQILRDQDVKYAKYATNIILTRAQHVVLMVRFVVFFFDRYVYWKTDNINRETIEDIRQRLAVAQRGGEASLSYQILSVLIATDHQNTVQPIGIYQPAMAPPCIPSRPIVLTPAMYNPVPAATYPAELRKRPILPGYSAAHLCYVELKQGLAAQAYAQGPTAEVVSIKFWLKTLVPGRKHAIQIHVRTI